MALHALQSGYLLNEYRVDKLLGEGGFGLTYLAFDTNLEKKVAIKEYMPSEHALREQDSKIVAKSDTSKKVYDWGLNAFINEAKILAKFENSNIVRVHRFFKANGTAYIVMEYCEGGCLIDRISKNHHMSESVLKEIISSLVRGLQLVHNNGILHRDIKPENIMFREDGTPVLIDFGAARQAIGSKNQDITTIVTPGYAPIEQYSSEGNIGPWSDIYSLSAVAYLCLTGKRPPDITNRLQNNILTKLGEQKNASPFLKSIDAGLELQVLDRPQSLYEWSEKWIEDFPKKQDVSSLTNVDSSKLTMVNSDTIDLEKEGKTKIFKTISTFALIVGIVVVGFVISQFVSKQPSQTDEILKQNSPPVKQVIPPTKKNGEPNSESIAVLPLTNLSSDKEADFLGFALTEQIIGKLVYNKNIQVKGSSLIRKYNKKNGDPITIGQELNVRYILSGNYLKQKSDVRFNFELLDVKNKELIWRETQQQSYDDLFQLQDTIANTISQKLDFGLTPQEYSNTEAQKTIDSVAYDFYLRSISQPYTKEGNLQALKQLNKAIAIEPNYAPIHLQLAIRFNSQDAYGYLNKNDETKVEEHFLKALELKPTYFKALSYLSNIYYQKGEFIKSYKLAKKMVIINSKNSGSYYTLGQIYRKSGMVKKSIKMYEKSATFGLSTSIKNKIGFGYFQDSQYEKALSFFDFDSTNAQSIALQGDIYLRIGDTKKALELFQRSAILYPDSYWGRDAEIFIAIIKKEKENGLSMLALQEKNIGSNISEITYYMARQYAALKDKDNALRLYEKSVMGGYYNLPMMRLDQFFDFLRKDAKYIEIINLAKKEHLTLKQVFNESL